MDTSKVKRVFISYSWDNELHQKWVLDLAIKLISDGIDVIIDRFELNLGKDLLHFMETSVKQADKVILIFTENYKLKSEKRSGGVGYEFSIISSEIYKLNIYNHKFIPILRSGTSNLSIPAYFESKIYLDLTQDVDFLTGYETLVRELYDSPKIMKPKLGPRPEYVLHSVNAEEEFLKNLEFQIIEKRQIIEFRDSSCRIAHCIEECEILTLKDCDHFIDIYTTQGRIDNVIVNPGKIISKEEHSGNLRTITKFETSYKSGEIFRRNIAFDFIDSHLGNEEFHTIWSTYPCRKFELVIVFPNNKIIKSFKALKHNRKFDRNYVNCEIIPVIISYYGKQAICLRVVEPEMYTEYEVRWEW